MDQEQNMIGEIAPFVAAGFAIHWLKPKSKAPVDDKWSEAPVASLDELKRTYHAGQNVGIRPGKYSKIGGLFVHLIDLDIRDASKAAEARTWLREHFPEAAKFPMVMSGSGGESRHIYFLTDYPFRSKKLAHSEGFTMKFDPVKQREVKHWDWEIELFGTNKQAAMPPSIHPVTGKPYTWVRPFDFDEIELGGGPIIASDRVFSWAPQRDDVPATEQKPKLGMSLEEAKRTLAHLPLDEWCEDRDGWLQVGMAIHHEFAGSEEGFNLWVEFSKQSTKFDAKNQLQVWKSFRQKPNSVRMATLVKASHIARLHDMFDEEDDEDDLDETDSDDDDFLGDAPKSAADAEVDEWDALIGGAPAKAAKDDYDPDNEDWKQLLDLTDGEKPAIKPSLPNIELILAHDPRTRGLMRFNLFTQEVVYRGIPGRMKRNKKRAKPTKQLDGPIWVLRDPINGDLWSSEKDNAIRSVLESPKSQGGWGLKIADRDMKAAVDLTARKNSFHPVREYLDSLVWDGVPRLDSLFVRHLGAEDTAYTRGVARVTLLGGVTRAYEPGHKFDFVAILEGDQGKRKSTFIETLAKSWFSELNGNFHDRKEMVERMQGSWIVELPELQGFTKSEVQDIKAFVSAREDKVRLAFAPRAAVYQRQCVMMGSTNEDRYLRDLTGGRRFWPIRCLVDTIDIDALMKEVDQVWAEAVAVYREMRAAQPKGTLPLYLSGPEAASEAAKMQEERRVETAGDMMVGLIEAWLNKPLPMGFDDADADDLDVPADRLRQVTCGREIWGECLGHDQRTFDHRAQQMIGQAMAVICKEDEWRQSSGSKKVDFEKYGRQRYYYRKGWVGI